MTIDLKDFYFNTRLVRKEYMLVPITMLLDGNYPGIQPKATDPQWPRPSGNQQKHV